MDAKLTNSLEPLETLYLASKRASREYADALDEVAETSGRNRRALARYVQARVQGKLNGLRAELAALEQLDLDFGTSSERDLEVTISGAGRSVSMKSSELHRLGEAARARDAAR